MKTTVLFFLSLALLHPTPPAERLPASPAYAWRQLTPKAAFAGSYNFDLFATDAYAYALHPDGTWRSADGVSWENTALPNALGNVAFADYVQFNGGVYALGTVSGNIETYQQTSRIARTTDFKTWHTVAESSNLPKLIFYKSVVFNGKIWLLGGFDGKRHTNEVWSSTDAVRWSRVTPHAAWSPRNPGGVVVFRNRLYLIGGGEIDKPAFTDVWSSENGKDWRLETPRMHPTPFWGYHAVAFDNQLWLVGCNRGGAFTNEVMRSFDGKTWQPERAPWSPRGAVATTIFRGNLLLTGGKFSETVNGDLRFDYRNDVWQLSRN